MYALGLMIKSSEIGSVTNNNFRIYNEVLKIEILVIFIQECQVDCGKSMKNT